MPEGQNKTNPDLVTVFCNFFRAATRPAVTIIFAAVIAQVVIDRIDAPQWFLALASACILWWFGDRMVQHIKEKKGGTNKRNGTGPPIGARGPRDGRGGGNPGRPGPGAGAKSGGQKGTCR